MYAKDPRYRQSGSPSSTDAIPTFRFSWPPASELLEQITIIETTPLLEMRLRFRGACWDEAPASVAPPFAPIIVPRYGKQDSNNTRLLPRGPGPSEGRVGTPTELGVLPRRPQPVANLSPWSCAAAFKRSWRAHETGQLGSKEPVRDKDRRPASKSAWVRIPAHFEILLEWHEAIS